MNRPAGRQSRSQVRLRRALIVAGAVGLTFAVLIGAASFLLEVRKSHPDGQVMLSDVAFMTAPLVVLANVVYSRDRDGGDR